MPKRRCYIAGIDVSTKAISIVVLDLRNGALIRADELPVPTLKQLNKNKAERPRSFDKDVFMAVLRDVHVVYVEQPMGRFIHAIAEVERMVGAVLAAVPPKIAVNLIDPQLWREFNGLARVAPKDKVAEAAVFWYPVLEGESQDLKDAACIARAGIADYREFSG